MLSDARFEDCFTISMQLYEEEEDGELSPVSWGSAQTQTRPSLPPLPAMNERSEGSEDNTDDDEPVQIVFSQHKYEEESQKEPQLPPMDEQPIVNITNAKFGIQLVSCMS